MQQMPYRGIQRVTGYNLAELQFPFCFANRCRVATLIHDGCSKLLPNRNGHVAYIYDKGDMTNHSWQKKYRISPEI